MNTTILTIPLAGERHLELVHGDLTEEKVGAIVNAANADLAHGGGVAGAIAIRGGAVITDESAAWVRKYGPVKHSEPAYTRAGRLPCQYVIHAVGPVWGAGDEDNKLAAAITGSLELADRLELTSLSFPPISTGIFGFPKLRAAAIFLDTIRLYFTEHAQSGLKQVRMTIIDSETLAVFEKEWKKV